MEIKPIVSGESYQLALSRLEELFDEPIGSVESDEADILAVLIDEYEKRQWPIEAPDPIEAIKIRMEEMDLRQKDLIEVMGGKNRVSEILNKRRKLTLEMVRKLTLKLNISASLLIKEYDLAS